MKHGGKKTEATPPEDIKGKESLNIHVSQETKHNLAFLAGLLGVSQGDLVEKMLNAFTEKLRATYQ